MMLSTMMNEGTSLKVGYEEDGHTILDLEEIHIHEIRQEKPNAQFQY